MADWRGNARNNRLRDASIDEFMKDGRCMGQKLAGYKRPQDARKSAANMTRKDIEEFLGLAAEIGLKPEVQEYALEEANTALLELKERKIRARK